MKASNSMRLLAWLAILVTLGFGLRPFNFYSCNDVAFDPETSSSIFHGQSEQRYHWQRGIAYANDSFFVTSESPFTAVLQLTQGRSGLWGWGQYLSWTTMVSSSAVSCPMEEPPRIRSRRSEVSRGRPYREMGVSNIFENDTTMNLAINYDGEKTGVFVNGKLEESNAYQLIESGSSVTPP